MLLSYVTDMAACVTPTIQIPKLFEVVIPKMAFKFGANNLNFIRVRQVRSGFYVMLSLMLFVPQMGIIFGGRNAVL